jgi:hypothetical protein
MFLGWASCVTQEWQKVLSLRENEINLFQTWKITSNPCTTSSTAWTRPASTFNLRAKTVHVHHGHTSTLESRVILRLNVVARTSFSKQPGLSGSRVPYFSLQNTAPSLVLLHQCSCFSHTIWLIHLVMSSINTVHNIITRIFIYSI